LVDHWKVNWSADEAGEVPLGVVTVVSDYPAELAGETAVIERAEVTVNEVAGVDPNITPRCQEPGTGDGHGGAPRLRPDARADRADRRGRPRS